MGFFLKKKKTPKNYLKKQQTKFNMTIIKIPFTKKNISQIPADKLPPGTKGVEVEITTDFLMSQVCSLEGIVHGPIQDAPFEKIAFIFKDDAEKANYDALLDSKNQNF